MEDLEGRKELLKISGLKAGKVLDVGMGKCGCMSLFLARRGFKVTGIDISSWAVHKSRKEASRYKLKGSLEIRRANAEKLPFPDNSFDAVFAYHSLHHIKNVGEAIKEMFRVCKKGGLVVISDLHSKGRKEYEHEPDRDFMRKVGTYLKRQGTFVQKARTKINLMFIYRKDS